MDIKNIPFYRYNTIIVGTGAAGLNAALSLHKLGQMDIALVTEGIHMGTSRNTGSDKQTYYKLTLCGHEPDSVGKMAETLFQGGCMDGDLAMAEAAGSLKAFFHLTDIGVPFPFNRMGEYVGYKTDHDPLKRGTSAGPLTSRYMTECLEAQIRQRQIPVFDGYQAIKLFTEEAAQEAVQKDSEEDAGQKRACGLMALNLRKCYKDKENPHDRYALFSARNIIWATGGEAGMYEASVYPVSQTGGMGVLLREGVKAKNLTESQFGIASVKFRWNLSGTFQQCLPRYVSTDSRGGDEREFLKEYFDSEEKLLTATFLKGYQWPFDPRKAGDQGSSLIDLLVYQERVLKGRRVYLDFIHNPEALTADGKTDFTHLTGEAREYLENCHALKETPFERLHHMNPSAVKVYSSHHIDLSREYLEIAVCAQHNNGGIAGNQWWETSLPHLFAIGEVNGSHGVYRPGGSALNSGQVGGIRAAQYIAGNYRGDGMEQEIFLEKYERDIRSEIEAGERVLNGSPVSPDTNNGVLNAADRKNGVIVLKEERRQLGTRMTRYGACIRSGEGIEKAIAENQKQYGRLGRVCGLEGPGVLREYYRLRQLLISQRVYLEAMKDYDSHVGISRGSFLVHNCAGVLPHPLLSEIFRNITKETDMSQIQEITYQDKDQTCSVRWRSVRPIPEEDSWFENVWKDYRENVMMEAKT